jgi:hypothetical protein
MEKYVIPHKEIIEKGEPMSTYQNEKGQILVTTFEIIPGIGLHNISLETYNILNKCFLFYLNLYKMAV